MSQTIVKQPAGFVTELVQPVSKGEVAIVPAKLSHGDQLKAVRALARNAKSEFDAVTYGKVGFNSRTSLQQTAKSFDGMTLGSWFGGIIVGSFCSFVAGLAASGVAGDLAGNVVLGAGVAASFLAVPAAFGVRMYARYDQAQAAKRLVGLDGNLAAMLDRFETAQGAEKAMLGATLVTWRDAMNAEKALEPRARAALDAAVVKYNALADADKARAVIYTALDLFLDNPQAMSVEDIRRFREMVATFEDDERRDVTAACIDIIKQSGRTLDYDASYELHLLEVDNEQQRAARSAKEVSAAFAAQNAGGRDGVSTQ